MPPPTDLGEAALLRRLNDLQTDLDRHRVTKDKLNIGMQELTHLHSQLNAITLQCTIIVGFALSGIGPDTLSQLADDEGQFCMYKSERSLLMTYGFLGFTLLSIFSAMTIIACSQKIIAESNRCMLFEAVDRLAGAVVHQTKYLTDIVSIAFELCLFLFFINTVCCVGLYFWVHPWVPADAAQSHVLEPGTTPEEVWNPDIIYTTISAGLQNLSGALYRRRCVNPYDESSNVETDALGSVLAACYVGVSALLLTCYAVLRTIVTRRYSTPRLEELHRATVAAASDGGRRHDPRMERSFTERLVLQQGSIHDPPPNAMGGGGGGGIQ